MDIRSELKSEKNFSKQQVNAEVQKLLELIRFKNLYRRGLFLYDAHFVHPQYSILEFAWTFCSYPPIASEINAKLESSISDIPSAEGLNGSQIDEYIKELAFKYLEPNDGRDDINPELMRFLWFLLHLIKNGDTRYSLVTKGLIARLKDLDWKPAEHYERLFHKYMQYQ
jgi:hypothetical protein